jgi:hypothetical protein
VAGASSNATKLQGSVSTLWRAVISSSSIERAVSCEGKNTWF